MRTRTHAPVPHALVVLDPAVGEPLHRQLYGGLRSAVLGGRLAPGTRLPSARTLALDLSVARNTVETALAQLRAEGYVVGKPRSGNFVARVLPDDSLRVAPAARPSTQDPRPAGGAVGGPDAPRLSRRGAAVVASPLPVPATAEPRAFRPGIPALDAFPRMLWGRLTARRWRDSWITLGYCDPAGFRPLREAIATYAAAARGVRCTPEQVVVTAGSQQAIDLAARLLLDPGDRVWVEEPGYTGTRAALRAADARAVAVPMDDEGISVAVGERLAPDARMACVTPSRGYPTGVTMSAARRLALLAWAERAGAWVVEDDYDSEFRYAGRPLPSLQGMDGGGRVIYLGTFSKTLFPALRIGYLIVPPALATAFATARGAADRHSPTLEQAVVADFLAEGHFARHVRRMRTLYAERRDALLEALRPLVAEGLLELGNCDAGMHVVGWLPGGVDDRAVSAALLARGVEATAVSRYCTEPPARGGLLLGFAGFSPATLRDAAPRLARVLREEIGGWRASVGTTGGG
jgi:GntR family transcriptional regulator/MocR family aminotransferase